MRCFACETAIPLRAAERVAFRDTCPKCSVDLHVCLNCAHHDPSAYNECREPGAERVSDRDRANRCEWFTPIGLPGGGFVGEQAKARTELEAIFKKPRKPEES